jgi:glycosyltransferase involved in cell wall biosynthesis/GT2 family glycosyltransferase
VVFKGRQYPKIGVVTPVRNRRNFSVTFVEEFCKQDYPVFVLYIVDSASTDGTPESIRALGANNVVVLEAKESAYWTEATNVGVRRALLDQCDFVLTLNDDAIVSYDFLSKIVASATEAKALVVGSVNLYADRPATIWGAGAYNDWATGSFVQTTMANLPIDALAEHSHAYGDLMPAECLCGNGTLIHKSVFNTIGLYDERATPHYHADSEFTMRAGRAGISIWLALKSRLYNRFTDSADGVFAPKNRMFFSIRSANFVRPILYLIIHYCPPELRGRAFLNYYSRYITRNDWRKTSKLLRGLLLLLPLGRNKLNRSVFFPPRNHDLSYAEDLEIIIGLDDANFVYSCYFYLLGRVPKDSEFIQYYNAARNNSHRHLILRDFITSSERINYIGKRDLYGLALLAETQNELDQIENSLTRSQREILHWKRSNDRLPTSIELDDRVDQIMLTDLSSDVNSCPTIYFNVDVMCMAETDLKAKTGVHRYVSCLLNSLLADNRIKLKIFCSESLLTNLHRLVVTRPELGPLIFNSDERIDKKGIAFYPYFPMGFRNTYLAHLPQTMTICDLFPLTNPEWFSRKASEFFKQQLHTLVGIDHVFCISRSTQDQLKLILEPLNLRSSIAYLAADKPIKKINLQSLINRTVFRTNYFLCVGTIEPRKNLITVITAFNKLDRKVVGKLKMIVVGQEGWNIPTNQLYELSATNREHINFIGRVSDNELWSLYSGAKFIVFPSLAEGFGLPILESFSFGKPVITSNSSSMAEIATKGAILVDPLDPDEIAEAITRLIRDTKLLKRLGNEAIEHASEFSWHKCADDHIRVFLQMTNSEFR